MDPDKIIILPERQNPILANQIKYYESVKILKIHAAQEGQSYPFPTSDPSEKTMTMTDVRAAVAAAQEKDAETARKTEAAIVETRSATTAASVTPCVKEVIKPKRGGALPEAGQAALLGMARDIECQLSQTTKRLTEEV